MARRRRIQEPGLIHHVMSRGNGRMCIFLDDRDHRKFIYVLGDVVAAFEIECWNYCLMKNHYHLTVRTTKPNLSRAIRQLNSVYAQWWNARHERVGHVFQGRFKDQIVQRERYLLNLCKYVALNPVRGGLVKDAADWPWSSYPATAGHCPEPDFLQTDDVLAQFGDAPVSRLRERYAEFVRRAQPDFEWWADRIRSKQHVLGDRSYCRHFDADDTGEQHRSGRSRGQSLDDPEPPATL